MGRLTQLTPPPTQGGLPVDPWTHRCPEQHAERPSLSPSFSACARRQLPAFPSTLKLHRVYPAATLHSNPRRQGSRVLVCRPVSFFLTLPPALSWWGGTSRAARKALTPATRSSRPHQPRLVGSTRHRVSAAVCPSCAAGDTPLEAHAGPARHEPPLRPAQASTLLAGPTRGASPDVLARISSLHCV